MFFNRRPTQMDADKELFKNFTAETQSTQREEFLPNRETAIGQNLKASTEICFCLSSSPDKQKIRSLRPLRLCGEMAGSLSAKIGDNRQLSNF